MKVSEKASVSFMCFSGSTVQLSRAGRQMLANEASHVSTGTTSSRWCTQRLWGQMTILSECDRSTVTQQTSWETRKSGFCHSCQTFVKSSEMVLIAMPRWFYTRQTLFHTALGDIVSCYLRGEQRERVTSCADAVWSCEETWSCSLLWSALERVRKTER